jgi:hypothetical protein
MNCSKFFIVLYLVVFCTLHARAQDSDYVYKDSSVIIADSIATRALIVDMKRNNHSNDNSVVDTVLRNKQLSIVNDSAEALKKTVAFAYAKNLDSILKAIQQQKNKQVAPAEVKTSWLEKFFFSPFTKVFFWTLAAFFIGFILYKLFFTQGFFQRQPVKSKVTVLPEEEDRLFSTKDYNKLITQAVANKDYRLAVRYHYLQTLQKLAAKGTIQFTADKTNYQYIREIFGKPYKDEFVSLTLYYEYAWYGRFEMNEVMFTTIENNFKQFNIQL